MVYSLHHQWHSRFIMILLKWFIMILSSTREDHYKPIWKDHYKPRTSLTVQAVCNQLKENKWKNNTIISEKKYFLQLTLYFSFFQFLKKYQKWIAVPTKTWICLCRPGKCLGIFDHLFPCFPSFVNRVKINWKVDYAQF